MERVKHRVTQAGFTQKDAAPPPRPRRMIGAREVTVNDRAVQIYGKDT